MSSDNGKHGFTVIVTDHEGREIVRSTVRGLILGAVEASGTPTVRCIGLPPITAAGVLALADLVAVKGPLMAALDAQADAQHPGIVVARDVPRGPRLDRS